MNYTFTGIIIILLCLLTLCAAPIQNPSLKDTEKTVILPKPKPKTNDRKVNDIISGNLTSPSGLESDSYF